MCFGSFQTALFISIQDALTHHVLLPLSFCSLVHSPHWGPCLWMAVRPHPLTHTHSSSCCFWECAHDRWNIQWPHCWLSCAPYQPPPSPKSNDDEDDEGDGAEDGCGREGARDAAFINHRCCHNQGHPETSGPFCRQGMCTHQWPDVPAALGL